MPTVRTGSYAPDCVTPTKSVVNGFLREQGAGGEMRRALRERPLVKDLNSPL